MSNEVPSAVITIMGKVMTEIMNPIVGVLFVAALAYFLWGLFTFMANMGEESKIAEGKQHMLWGIIGMTIMVSVFAILKLSVDTLNITDGDLPAPINL